MKHLAARSPIVFAAFLAIYASGAARTVQGGDAGEFMALSALSGVAHPPGYPLFTSLLSFTAFLPLGTPAFRASLVSAALAAGAAALIHAAIRSLTDSPAAAWIAAGFLGFSLTFWQYATVAEVFAGGALTAALVIFAAARIAGGWRGHQAQLALGLSVATGVANHHTVVLLAPLAFWAWYTALSRPLSRRSVSRETLTCAAGLACGFLAYLTLMIPGGGWRWGDTSSLGGLTHHFLRGDYGTFQLALDGASVGWWEHPLFYLRRAPTQLFGVGALAALVGVWAGLREARWRGFAAALLATWVLAGPLFLTQLNVSLDGMGSVVAARFHILPTVLSAVFIGLGVAWASRQPWGRVVAPLCALAVGAQALAHHERASHADWTVMEDYILNTLDAVAPGALIVGVSDSFFFGTLYAQRALGVRPDVAFLHPSMLVYDWYVEDMNARFPGLNLPGYVSVPELVAGNLDVRPVYLSRELLGKPEVAGRVSAYPESAVLMRAVSPEQGLPTPEQVEAQMDAAVQGFTFRSKLITRHQATETWEVWAVQQYAGAYETLADAFTASGDAEGAARCREKAAVFVPLELAP